MTVIDSYRDTDGAKKLINQSIEQYREVYKQWEWPLNKPFMNLSKLMPCGSIPQGIRGLWQWVT